MTETVAEEKSGKCDETEPRQSSASVADASDYAILDSIHICRTVDQLLLRIEQRFPGRGICGICQRLQDLANNATGSIEVMTQPILWLRAVTGALLLLFLVGLGVSLFAIDPTTQKALGFVQMLGVLESAINDIIFIAAGVFFLVTLESRLKRKKALKAVHELRSLVHIIDMHQLTKDPERVQPEHLKTESSPAQGMSSFELNRYLDYCSEMLSLSAKLAALYAQHFADSVVLAAVGEVENLSLGLSSNIWQKIAILQSLPESAGGD